MKIIVCTQIQMGCRCFQQRCSLFIIFILFISNLFIIYAQTDPILPSFTPINRDLYHQSDALLEEIKSLVDRHPDKLSMETLNSKNRGYEADVKVVTYCQNREETDEKSKFRILIMIACIPEFWSARAGAYYN